MVFCFHKSEGGKRRNKNEQKNGGERRKSLRKLLIKSIHGASQVQTMPPLYCVPFDSYQNAPLYAIFSVYKEKSFSMETLIVRGSLLLNGDFSMLMQRSTMFTLLFSSAKRESIARTLIEQIYGRWKEKRRSRGIDKNTINCALLA